MTRQTRRLPGGRGVWKGEDAYVGQNENFITRAGRIPDQRGEIICSVPASVPHTSVQLDATASIFELFPIGSARTEVAVESFAVRVLALSGSTVDNVTFALYALQHRSSWGVVAGTGIELQGLGVGLHNLTIEAQGAVQPNVPLALGWVKSASWSGTANFAGVAIGANNLLQIVRKASTNALPARIDTDDGSFTSGTGTSLPAVCFTTKSYEGVL
jgi:hypothetical protein